MCGNDTTNDQDIDHYHYGLTSDERRNKGYYQYNDREFRGANHSHCGHHPANHHHIGHRTV
ncbi:MAG: hypothetical protein OXD34_08925 [bacterium]|nr:hypothetical protein [bacterium]